LISRGIFCSSRNHWHTGGRKYPRNISHPSLSAAPPVSAERAEVQGPSLIDGVHIKAWVWCFTAIRAGGDVYSSLASALRRRFLFAMQSRFIR
jgi:hypothetical protein